MSERSSSDTKHRIPRSFWLGFTVPLIAFAVFWSAKLIGPIANSQVPELLAILLVISSLSAFFNTLVSIVVIMVQQKRSKPIGAYAWCSMGLAGGFLSAIFATAVLLPLLPRPMRYPNGSYAMKFDSARWKDAQSEEFSNGISDRERMLGDLVTNILPGKSKIEIEELLAPSLETPYFSSVNKDLIYYLGPERDHWINIDSEWLLIWLDKNGRFKRCEIRND